MGFHPDRNVCVLRYMLEQQARELPNKDFVLFEDGKTWSYEKALQETYRAANSLRQMGIKRGKNVLIFLPNSPDWLRAWWGTAALGAAFVPVNTAYKGGMLRHICQNSQARHVITSTHLAERINELDLDLEILDPSMLLNAPVDEPGLDEPIEPWDTHVIMYTSGTTGLSKGVIQPYMHTFRGGIWMFDFMTGDDTFLVDSPLFHVSGLFPIYTAISAGSRVAVRTVFSGKDFWEITRRCGATIIQLQGSTGEYLAKMPPKPDDADNPVRIAMGGPGVVDTEGFLARFGIKEWLMGYGMTETGTIFRQEPPVRNQRGFGRVRPGLEVRLVDEHDIPVPSGEPGELIIRSDQPWEISPGYWNRPEESAKAWRNGWFHTGDLLRCDTEGTYFLVDRKKDALRRRGENISSSEVEREVLSYPDVVEAACIGVPAEFGLNEEEVKVFIVPRKGAQFDPAELIRFLVSRMPHFMVPRFVEVVSELPKTPSSRVMKFELRKQGNSATTWDREAAGMTIKRG
jgi:carnitine-CoA ligase